MFHPFLASQLTSTECSHILTNYIYYLPNVVQDCSFICGVFSHETNHLSPTTVHVFSFEMDFVTHLKVPFVKTVCHPSTIFIFPTRKEIKLRQTYAHAHIRMIKQENSI